MPKYRVVKLSREGQVQHQDYKDLGSLLADFDQRGVEEDSYTIRLHGEPILKGLIGPLSEGKSIVRYETPEAFAVLTESWTDSRRNGRNKKS